MQERMEESQSLLHDDEVAMKADKHASLIAWIFASGSDTAAGRRWTFANPWACESRYALLQPEPSAVFPYSSGYGPKEATNHTYADELWESIDIDAGVVAIPHEWAAERNLAPSQAFPWDDSKGVYVINGFHTLHCLKNLHRIVYEAHHGWPLSRSVPHALHCLDHMRKDALCSADDFLMPTPPEHYADRGPRGQARVCRNWDQLVDWSRQHHACYQHLTDEEDRFAQENDELVRYLNCPEDSPYFDQATAYRQARLENSTT